MTPQERDLLATFLQQLTQAQAGQKDADAETLIRDAASRQPDANYLLVQRAMALDLALQATQAQMTKLQAEVDQLKEQVRETPKPAASSSFLDANAWGRSGTSGSASPAAAPAPAAFTPAFPPNTPLRAAPGGAPAAAPAAAPASAWGAGILGTVATTAAGVVAGSLLYSGIQGMMGHHNQTANAAPPATPPAAPVPEHQAALEQAPEPEELGGYADSGDSGYDSGDSA